MTTGPEPARYRFGPLERRGLIAGWRSGQVGTVAAGLVLAVVILRAGSAGWRLVGAVAAVALSLALACWPVAGQTPEQWAPLSLSWAARVLGRRHRHLSRLPTLGRLQPQGPGVGAAAAGGDPAARMLGTGRSTAERQGRARPWPAHVVPPSLASCRILAPPVAAGELRVGVVHDLRARTFTAVLSATGAAFSLLDPDEQQRRVSAWSGVLAGLAREGTFVHRLQWVQRSLPGCLADPAAPSRETVLPPDRPAARSYAQLLQRTGAMARGHEVLLALSVHADKAGRAVRGAAGGAESACAVLAQELRSLQVQLSGADVLVEGAMAPRTLIGALRRSIEVSPAALDALAGRPGPAAGAAAGPAPAVPLPTGEREVDPEAAGLPWPWPLSGQASWSTYRTDGSWHATYWVAEWPRVEVGPGFLAGLLVHSGVRHTVSLTMEPVSPRQALRDVQHARTADVADAELRRRGGFLASARRQREAEVVARREVELADGHGQFRFSGYITVTASSAEALEGDCGRMEQAASQAHLELRRLYGQQDQAFTWTLPLGRGLA